MTPEEAVSALLNEPPLTLGEGLDGHKHIAVRRIIDECVVTAKATATTDETKRCAGLVREAAESDEIKECGGSEIIDILHCLYNDLLITGDLEVEVRRG